MATNNIEKLYELAKVKKEYYSFKTEKEEFTWELDENGNDKHNCIFCGEPEIKTRHFTPANQLELIKWIEQVLDFVDVIQFVYRPEDNVWFLYAFVVEEFAGISTTPYTGMHTDFSQALAGLVCGLWEDLTPEQREEIRRILQ